ncbi:MAG: metal ABC transporter substrate-binding protein [Longimicrobiales bacterium]
MVLLNLFAGVLLASSSGPPAAPLKVITTTTDLAAIAREVGGNRVTVKAMAVGTQDPHFVEAKPSLILDLRNADVFAQVGLGLEAGWAPLLLDQARNTKVRPGGRGYLDLSAAASVLDIPAGKVTRAEGDIHPFGNPHYWLGPENGKRMADMFARKFSELDPAGAEEYKRNLQAFEAKLNTAASEWQRLLGPLENAKVVAYHNSWKYFLTFAGLTIAGYIEPKPGIPPSPGYLAQLIADMKRENVKVVIVDPFYDAKVPRFVAEQAGAKLLILPSSVGGAAGVNDYVSLLDHNVRALRSALAD